MKVEKTGDRGGSGAPGGGGTGSGGVVRAGGAGGRRAADDWDAPQLHVNLLAPDDENITAIGERKRPRNQKQDTGLTKRKPPVPWMSAAAAAAAAEHRAALAALQREQNAGKNGGEAAREWNKRFYDELKRQLEFVEDAALAATAEADGAPLPNGTQQQLGDGEMALEPDPEPNVRVAGQLVPLRSVTDALRDCMTPDEYVAFYQAAAAYYEACAQRVRQQLEATDSSMQT
jgi:hypothetical protein